jgi:hypothetical protein
MSSDPTQASDLQWRLLINLTAAGLLILIFAGSC